MRAVCVCTLHSPDQEAAMFNQPPCKPLQTVIDLYCTFTHSRTQTRPEVCVTFLAVSEASVFSPSLSSFIVAQNERESISKWSRSECFLSLSCYFLTLALMFPLEFH